MKWFWLDSNRQFYKLLNARFVPKVDVSVYSGPMVSSEIQEI